MDRDVAPAMVDVAADVSAGDTVDMDVTESLEKTALRGERWKTPSECPGFSTVGGHK